MDVNTHPDLGAELSTLILFMNQKKAKELPIVTYAPAYLRHKHAPTPALSPPRLIC